MPNASYRSAIHYASDWNMKSQDFEKFQWDEVDAVYNQLLADLSGATNGDTHNDIFKMVQSCKNVARAKARLLIAKGQLEEIEPYVTNETIPNKQGYNMEMEKINKYLDYQKKAQKKCDEILTKRLEENAE